MALLFRQLFDKESSTYTYLLADSETGEGVLIDPVLEQVERDLKLIKELNINLIYIIETHVHADHITGAHQIRKGTGAKIVTSSAEVNGADLSVSDGDEISYGSYKLKVIFTPGHTSTCSSYFTEGMVFTGDTLMIRGTGRTDFQGGSAALLYESIIQKLFTLPDDTLVYPAHNYNGMLVSTIGEEKRLNPRLGKGKEEFINIMNNLNLAYPKKMDVAVPANLVCGEK